MGRWKRHGVIVILYSTDHDPKHVHIFEDRKRLLKFDIETWTVMEGKLTTRRKERWKLYGERGSYEKSEI